MISPIYPGQLHVEMMLKWKKFYGVRFPFSVNRGRLYSNNSHHETSPETYIQSYDMSEYLANSQEKQTYGVTYFFYCESPIV